MNTVDDTIKECEGKLQKYLPINPERLQVEQLPEFIQTFTNDYLVKLMPTIIDEALLLDAITILSVIACHRRVKIALREGATEIYPNIYALKIMPSSSGKDRPLAEITERILQQSMFIHKMKSEYREFIDKFNSDTERILGEYLGITLEYFSSKELKAIKAENYPHAFSFVVDNATTEGVVKYAQGLQMWGQGVVFIKMAEFGIFIKGASSNISRIDFLSTIQKMWDVQEFGAKVIKSSYTAPSVRDIPCVFSGSTATQWIKSDEDKEMIMNFIGGGMGRRTFVLYPEQCFAQRLEGGVEEQRKQQDEWITEAYGKEGEIVRHLLDRYENTKPHKTFIADEKALELYNYYSTLNSKRFEKYVDNQESMASEYNGRPWKMFRIAGLFAWLRDPIEGVITKEDMGRAIYFTEHICTKTSNFIYEQENKLLPGEEIMKWLMANPGKHTQTEIRKLNIIPWHNFYRQVNDEVIVAREYGTSRGYALEVINKNNKITYEAIKIEKTDEDKIKLMVAPKKDDFKVMAFNTKYEKLTTQWDQLHEICKNYCYMPQLNNGVRGKKNFIPGGVLMGLDIDENWTLTKAREYLESNNIKSFIITTSSHQKAKSKDGKKIKPRDKFRVLILLSSPFTGTAREWGYIMENFMHEMGDVADASCKDVSRFFYPSPQGAKHYYIEGEPLDWREYMSKPVKRPVKTSKRDNLQRAIEYASKKYGTVKEGERDNFLNEIWHWNFKKQGLSQHETYEICKEINSKFCSPAFSEKAMEKWNRSE
jgi:hypothetical protein